jgi:hypothetical protein
LNVVASFSLDEREFGDAISQLERFERTRFFVAIGLILVIGVASLLLYTKIPSLIAAVAVIALGVLCYRSLRLARLAHESGRRLTGHLDLTVRNDGLRMVAEGRSETTKWADFVHCTKTREAWIFVRKANGSAYIIPDYALTADGAHELSRFLESWSKRRFRRIPAASIGRASSVR